MFFRPEDEVVEQLDDCTVTCTNSSSQVHRHRWIGIGHGIDISQASSFKNLAAPAHEIERVEPSRLSYLKVPSNVTQITNSSMIASSDDPTLHRQSQKKREEKEMAEDNIGFSTPLRLNPKYSHSTHIVSSQRPSIVVGPIDLVLELVDKLLITRQHIRTILNKTAECPQS